MKMEEEKYPNVGSINRCSYRIMHHCDDYTLMMQYNPKKEGTEVQYVIWDKAGNRTVVPTDQRASFSLLRDSRGTPVYTPSIYKVSHDHYYILANMPKKFILVELKVKP